ncbi:phosphonate metabolism transcriptional regulator PhnF [Plastoroseomonas arctica]|uniref:Phosphonate metabolism transcriptional regulator PhnF n=1 Tax=Plastoroseomonas arctica TaxID=1509237 RepID=A0AAF1JWB1_9PROT|nr:phosphonate metabolism transcriptional regulator PhnF [Plastoroseomonas arctica]MBR0654997.1 phosphonate metabolism transcriptional regulator PhnF [Plastoroseomonas arctica]
MVEALVTGERTTTATLDRGRGVSLWHQIASAIERDIIAGLWIPGARLPTEAEFTARFAVNRHTVRRAMESLESRGMIRIEQGRGSFVAEDVLEYPLGTRTRFSENIRRQKKEPQGRILGIETIAAEGAVATALGLRRGRPVLRVERLAMANGTPIVIGAHHFPLPRFEAMPAALAQQASITVALAACGLPDYHRVRTRVTARMPTAEEATLLHQARIRPLIVAEALNADPEGRPVDFTLSRYASGRVQIVVEGE